MNSTRAAIAVLIALAVLVGIVWLVLNRVGVNPFDLSASPTPTSVETASPVPSPAASPDASPAPETSPSPTHDATDIDAGGFMTEQEAQLLLQQDGQ